jgi:hypothetical protein
VERLRDRLPAQELLYRKQFLAQYS